MSSLLAPAAGVREFRLLGGTVLRRAQGTVSERLTAWLANWCVAAPSPLAVDVRSIDADTLALPACGWHALSGVEGRLWIYDDLDQRRHLLLSMLGSDFLAAPGPSVSGARGAISVDAWIDELVDEAWASRNAALADDGGAEALRARRTPLDAALRRPGAGAVAIRCSALGLHAVAEAPPGDAPSGRQPPLRPRGPIASVLQALARTPVRLEVALGGVELELSALLDLHPGDVLTLPTRLDQPLLVRIDGQDAGTVGLGALETAKAVRFLPASGAAVAP